MPHTTWLEWTHRWPGFHHLTILHADRLQHTVHQWPTWVARLSTCCTSSCVSVGFFRNNLTMAVSNCSCTWNKNNATIKYTTDTDTNGCTAILTIVFSSWNPSKNDLSKSSALSIRSAYSPTIQIIDALSKNNTEVPIAHIGTCLVTIQ